jgi:hypothetical protein
MTKDDITRMAREANIGTYINLESYLVGSHLERFAELVAAAEREACAKVCEALDDGTYAGGDQPYGIHYARAIRARGQSEVS